MAAKTTIKVALQSAAAKNDFFSADATGLTEDLLQASLNVLGNDPCSAHLYSLQQNISCKGQMAQVKTAFSSLGASITINSNGTIAYNAGNIEQSLSHLAEGQLVTDTFFYAVRMANGALSTAIVSLKIAGENDPPTLDSIALVNISDTASDDTPAAMGGTLTGHDVDDGAVLTYSLTDLTGVDTSMSGVQFKQIEYGTLTLHTATGAYSFLADPDKIDALPVGQTAQADFAVKVSDEHGASSALRDIVFNLIGANDTAVITGVAMASVTEDDSSPVGGTLSVSDRDSGAVGFAPASGLHGTYGNFNFNNTSGLWDYTLRNGDTNVQALALNEQKDDTLTVSSQDGSATETIKVTVTGANDRPILDNPSALLFFDTSVDDPSKILSSNLVGSDPDNSAVLQFTLVNLTGVTTSGNEQIRVSDEGTFKLNTQTGAYSFQTDATYIDTLLSGVSEIHFEVTAVDDQGYTALTPQTIRILMTGANDVATITGMHADSVKEDGQLTAGGTLSATDLDDNPANPIFQAVGAATLNGTYGNFTFNESTGVWGYTLRNGETNVQALALNEQKEDALTVSSQDGSATQTIKVTVNGANDAPTLDSPTTLHFTDTLADDPGSTQSATLSGHDIDGTTLRYTLTGVSGVTTSGNNQIVSSNGSTLTLNTLTGAYSYQIGANDIDATPAGLTTRSFGVQSIDVPNAFSSTQTIKIEIVGVNDPAKISGNFSGTVTEDGVLSSSGNVQVTDPDSSVPTPMFQTVSDANLKGIYGDFTFNGSTGVWGYALRNGDANVQALTSTSHQPDTLTVTSQGGLSQAIVVTVNGADEASTGGGPDPVLKFDIGPEAFFNSIDPLFLIPNFTLNDLIHFDNGVQYLSFLPCDFITDSNGV